jgi:hypothetical protein
MYFLQKTVVQFFTINFELIELIVNQPARILAYPPFQKKDA